MPELTNNTELQIISPEIISTNEVVLGLIDTEFSKRGITYFVIGSTARRAYMADDPKITSDYDILAPDHSQDIEREAAAKEVQHQLSEKGVDAHIDCTLAELTELIDGQFHLKYGKLDYIIDSSVMEKRRLKIGKTEFTSLPAETLLHSFSIGGPFREKDWHNSLRFARFVKSQPAEFSHNLFKPFHEFSKAQWNNFPLKRLQTSWRMLLNQLPPELKKVVLQNIYSNPLVEQIRTGLNRTEKLVCLR